MSDLGQKPTWEWQLRTSAKCYKRTPGHISESRMLGLWCFGNVPPRAACLCHAKALFPHRDEKQATSFFVSSVPDLVTGAADDDPSGIATYSQAGAQFGYGLLWTVFLTTPFMIAIQLVSAHIGRVTGKGIAANAKQFYPLPLVLIPGGPSGCCEHNQHRG